MPNESEFIRVIKENEGIVFKIAMLYAADRDDQKDLYQEIVYQLWRSFDSFRNESKISTWIYRIALNTSITHLRKEKRRGPKVAIDEAVINRFEADDSLMEERLTQLYDQVRKLNTIEKGIVLLHLEGKNYEEIATITGFTATNVGTRLSRIKDKLRSQLQRLGTMELDEMKNLWTEMSAKLEGQKKLTDKMIMMMTRERYQRKLSKIKTPELISTVVCVTMVLLILLSFNKFDTPYLLASAITSATILSVLPVLSLLAIRQVSRVDINASNYKEVLRQYALAKRRLLSVQKLSFYLSFVLLVVALPAAVRMMGGKTTHIETGTWLWYLPLGFLVFILFARWVYRYYVNVTVQLENVLQDIEEQ